MKKTFNIVNNALDLLLAVLRLCGAFTTEDGEDQPNQLQSIIRWLEVLNYTIKLTVTFFM